MARRHEAASLLESGCSLPEIAERMGISLPSAIKYLCTQVGEGKITRSDILFGISKETRDAVEQIRRQAGAPSDALLGVTRSFLWPQREEAFLYLDLCQPQVYMQDMYLSLYSLEVFFHKFIRLTLFTKFGGDWWRRGIPERIRADCAAARERDAEPAAEPYCYTTLGHLRDLFEGRWELFSKTLAPGPASERRRFLSDLARLNSIRNRVMHPAKGLIPSEEDFRFVREFVSFVGTGWKLEERFSDLTATPA